MVPMFLPIQQGTRSTPAKWIGTVDAVNADAAIKKAAQEFDVQDIKKLITVRRR